MILLALAALQTVNMVMAFVEAFRGASLDPFTVWIGVAMAWLAVTVQTMNIYFEQKKNK